MYILLAAIGLIVTGYGWVLMGMDQAPDYAGLVFIVGIGLILVGAIMANRAGRKQTD